MSYRWRTIFGLACFATAFAPAMRASAAPDDTRVEIGKRCDDAIKATTAPYERAAAEGRWGDVELTLGKAVTACRDQPLPIAMIDTARATAAYSAGDDGRAISILHERGVGRQSLFYLNARLVEAAARKRSGDDAGYRAIRDELVAANAEGLTGGSEPFMRRGEDLETPYARIEVFEEIPRGRALREIFLVAAPKDGQMPISVSYSFKVDDDGRQGAPLGHMDITWCDGNSLAENEESASTEAALNAQAMRRLSTPPPPTPIEARNGHPAAMDASFSLSLCRQAPFIFRGIEEPQ